jgi:outer membrane protein OmpA-like peptidoglycan-associated protein
VKRRWAAAALSLLAGLAQAQQSPGTRQMIEVLRPGGDTGRNLIIRRAAPPATPTATTAAASAAAADAAAASPATSPPASLSLPIQFEPESARVRPESGVLLGDLVAALASPELKDRRFVIEGPGEAQGSSAAQRLLSQQRAEEVRQYLILLGVNPARLQARGASESPDGRQARPVRVVAVR